MLFHETTPHPQETIVYPYTTLFRSLRAFAKAAGGRQATCPGTEEAAGRSGAIGWIVSQEEGGPHSRGAGTPAARGAGDPAVAAVEKETGEAGQEKVKEGKATIERAAGEHHRCTGDGHEDVQRRLQSGGERAVCHRPAQPRNRRRRGQRRGQ